MRTKIASCAILVVMVIVGAWPAGGQMAAPKASPFDRPLRTVRVDLGLSEFYEPAQKIQKPVPVPVPGTVRCEAQD